MVSLKAEMFDSLTDENKTTINNLIEFLLHKQNNYETKMAIHDAMSGNTIGSFDTVEDFLSDLYAEN